MNEDLRKGPEGPYDAELYDTGKGSRRGGLAAGDAEVIVYLGDPPDPEPTNEPGVSFDEAIVEGKVDAAVVLQDGEVKHEKLEDPV